MASLNLATAYIDIGLRGLDKIKGYMDTAVKAVQSSTSSINNLFQQSTSAIGSFVGAASPQAMNTLGASIELLKARLGQSFTPIILAASKSIQDLSLWVKNLDPETKKQIASWVMYGTAAAGAFYALNKGLDVIKMISANPLAMVLLGISAAALKVANDMDKMNKQMEDTIGKMERMKQGQFTEKEYKGGVADAIFGDDSMTPEQKVAKAKEMIEKLKAETKTMTTAGQKRGNLSTFGDSILEEFGQENQTYDDMRKVDNNLKQISMLEGAIKQSEKGKGINFANEKDVKKAAGGGDRLLLGSMMNGAGSAGVGGLDQSYNRLQSQALGQNDIQRELLKIQQEEMAEMREQSTNIKGLHELLRNAAGI